MSLSAQNPYLPLWEHLPDGEPRVFEDPDNPGKYRAYIIGSHDLAYTQYCGPDIRMWSAPVEDLSAWRDEGPIFRYFVAGQWDIMYAPDLVEVKDKTTGKKTYYLYPHNHANGRIAQVAKSDRPDGPYELLNVSEDGLGTTKDSFIGFDPSVFVEYIDNKKDPDYKIGYRAYVFYGFQHSEAAELDQNTMYSMRPGTKVRDYFLPASARYGVIRDPEGTTYPALYEGQNPGEFNFFEASSIRQVGNKYVMVFSGYSGPEYGLESTNSALRYAYSDSPMGPWRSGGVLVDSRAVVPNEDGTKLTATGSAHNTHGSIECINGQWYVFYHRPPRGFGYARQAVVAPVKIEWDKKSVEKGGKVRISGYDPFSENNEWDAKASNGDHYTGAEVTSEGFHIFGMDPYKYYTAGYACYLSDPGLMQDTWDNWDNHMDVAGVANKGVVGFKYFGFEGLAADSKGIKAFEGTTPGNGTSFNAFITATTSEAFKIHVMMDGPYANSTWNGKEIAVLEVPAGSNGKQIKLSADVASKVEGLKGKHAIYLVADGPESTVTARQFGSSQARRGGLFDLHGISFTKRGENATRPIPPTVKITVDGNDVIMPTTPVRFTNLNGYENVTRYQAYIPMNDNSVISVKASDPKVSVKVSKIVEGRATVTCTYNGQDKVYLLN
ncbi:MAG: hypothetical protein MJZ16_01520 [Bacteroidales bacterium]|nr:hypothetical protein [Bacteroidales bacterium]